MIQLDVSIIRNSPGEVRHLEMDVPLQPIESEPGEVIFGSPLRLDARLANEDGVLRLTGTLEGKARVSCSRCLDIFDMPVRAEIDEVYFSKSQRESGPGGESIPFRGDLLDITPEAEKAVLSSLPMKILCGEDCRGLCQKCGANLNSGDCKCSADEIDPRMEMLKKLLEKEK